MPLMFRARRGVAPRPRGPDRDAGRLPRPPRFRGSGGVYGQSCARGSATKRHQPLLARPSA
eukprot:6891061-Alexandrium_andersonii.AAC.1